MYVQYACVTHVLVPIITCICKISYVCVTQFVLPKSSYAVFSIFTCNFVHFKTTAVSVKSQRPVAAVNLFCVYFIVVCVNNVCVSVTNSQFIKQFYPDIQVAFGGGYCNTELRSLEDPRIFEIVDFISLDDGEGPLLKMLQLLDGDVGIDELERTFVLEGDQVVYKNKIPNTIHHHQDLPFLP